MHPLEHCPIDAARVLVVDDEEQNRLLLRDYLEARGYEITEARDGTEALALVRQQAPDVILLDVMMPGMNGFETCRQLKQNPATASIPVLMVTALSERQERLMGIQAGANDFLTKPVDLHEVALRVGNAAYTMRLFQQLQTERARSDNLLLNILPASFAERMKAGETNPADSHADVTVLCACLAGLETLFAHFDPESVLALLNEVFCEFDLLTELHNLEKVKTAASLYVVAAGLEHPQSNHVRAIAELGCKLRESLTLFNERNHTALGVSLGICSGPVVAGVVGRSRFSYDLWGETVNTAARLAALAPPGAIFVASETGPRLSDSFSLRDRSCPAGPGLLPITVCELCGPLHPSVSPRRETALA